MKKATGRYAKYSPNWFSTRTYPFFVAIMVFAIAGTLMLTLSQAATPVASYEAETGVRTGNASTLTDAAASAGSAVKFSATANPSGQPMPTTAPAGWSRVFSDDFNTNIPSGQFPQATGGRWGSYNGGYDSSGNGYYNDDLFSVSGGMLNLGLKTINGVPQSAGAAPLMSTNGNWDGMQYGRYSVRFKVDPGLKGWAAAWLLWSDNNVWTDGEIDFPEGELDGNIKGFNHCLANPRNNCSSAITQTPYASGWHTTTIEWSPNLLKFILDGTTVMTTTSNVPTASLHWVLQTETAYGAIPDPATTGNVQVDWVTMDRYAP
ncbi:glycosyl hydrolase family protein [Candidatus Saccharibacteria bacterium]|nr:MAG: glycosyl hydrolase family protein [Candidatus Saccharibacteria bacterium]